MAGVEGDRLSPLAGPERRRLLADAVPVRFAAGDVACEVGAPVPAVLLPTSGLLTVAVVGGGGSEVVVDAVGREGVLLLADAVGDATSTHRVRCLLPATAAAVPVPVLREALGSTGALGAWVRTQLQLGHARLARRVLCAQQHPATARCATWLLRAADSSGTDELVLTHQQLASVLGVRRVTVTTSLAHLREAGALGPGYGRVGVLDRGRLAASACECSSTGAAA